MTRYRIAPAAYAEVAETFGHLFALSVLCIVDQSRSWTKYAPVGVDGPIYSECQALFDDQVEEL